MTQQNVADELGVCRTTVTKDLQEIRPGIEVADSIIERAQLRISQLMKVEERVEKYVEHAKSETNGTLSLAALMRLDDLDGVVTQKELVRTRRDEGYNTSGPMFIMPEGAVVNVTLNQAAPQHVVESTDTQVVIDVESAQVVENKE